MDSGHRVLDFPWLGSGTAVIQMNHAGKQSNTLNMFHQKYIFNLFSTIQRRLTGKIQSVFSKKRAAD